MYAVYELSSRLCPMLNYMPQNILQKNPYAVALVVGSSLILALFSTIQSLHNTFDVLSDCRCLVHTGKVISLNLWKKIQTQAGLLESLTHGVTSCMQNEMKWRETKKILREDS